MRQAALVFMLMSMVAIAPARAGGREDLIVQNSTVVLRELQRMPDQGVPDWLLQRAKGIAIMPNVVKVGLALGGRGGSGVLHVRDEHGRWTNPSFIRIGGLSFGAQIGGFHTAGARSNQQTSASLYGLGMPSPSGELSP